MKDYVNILAGIFGYSSFNDEERQRRSILILLVGLTAIAGLIYSLIYLMLGVSQAIIAIIIYIGFSIINLTIYYFNKNYALFRNIQLVAILLFPASTHALNGGFDQSSAVILAAMLSPLGAMMFHTAKAARLFFFLFIFVLLIAVLLDLFIPLTIISIPKEIRLIFYFFNIVITNAIIFFLILKFVSDNEAFKQLLKTKNNELSTEKLLVEKTLIELKTTQSQLIQSEKMASLGELTAGIAHEIQNPLNFVNNFSEISSELLEEMKEELINGNQTEALTILDDVLKNLEKINHHGKRADSIVKGMLQHSRSTSGQKELTDINLLTDEYLRLSYHGLRAKDKSFNASIITDFDQTIDKIKLIPQDFGRVILNLMNNAFYVVNERKKEQNQSYEPKVTISTKQIENHVIISVSDNGKGIPNRLIEKVFQPFFTTKPTGQGTGLGLSLSYDIITKGHGGSLKVETKENVGTTFIIEIPI
jgi:signal transduction histidine kinase